MYIADYGDLSPLRWAGDGLVSNLSLVMENTLLRNWSCTYYLLMIVIFLSVILDYVYYNGSRCPQ